MASQLLLAERPATSKIIEGDVTEVLRTFPESSQDACLCDPPYGLTANKKGGSGNASMNLKSPHGRARIGTGDQPGGFMGMKWDHGVPGVETWTEVYRVLKPGAFLLAFGGTRTHHRLMCAIEDAGFILKDCMMWLYGSGFPKSLDVAQAIDRSAGFTRDRYLHRQAGHSTPTFAQDKWTKANHGRRSVKTPITPEADRWSGYGTALKPAYEIIIVAMKPCEGTFAQNALKHGVAGLAIDAGRIGTASTRRPMGQLTSKGLPGGGFGAAERLGNRPIVGSGGSDSGRWPANLILDEESAAALDRMSGEKSSRGHWPRHRDSIAFRKSVPFDQEERYTHDSGGASRFFYCAKASRRERGPGNNHPTVKPLKLLEYIARLILPPERATARRILVPFSGSGSEMLGALNAGWDEVVGIENSPVYVAIAENRMNVR